MRSHHTPTYEHRGAVGQRSLCWARAWAKSGLPPGQVLPDPVPLFKKLDERVARKSTRV